MREIILIAVIALTITGCSTKVELECNDSCEYTRDVDGKQAISCTGCSLEVEGREDIQLLDISVPSLPERP